MRHIVAFCILGGGVLLAIVAAFVVVRKRRVEKLRRRGVKSYNRNKGFSNTP